MRRASHAAMVRLGAWSAILLVFAMQLFALAAALAFAEGNRAANRLLAAALVVTAGLLTPFVIGYAGGYDAWPWLSFAPFAVPLALGPLLHAHLRALVGRAPLRWPHWVAPIAQFGWQAAAFALPLAQKQRFDAAVVEPIIAPVTTVAVLASLGFYAFSCWRVLRGYEAWLRQRRRLVRPARRLRAILMTLLVLLAARTLYDLFALVVRPLDYFDLFAFYILLGAAGTALGVEGWRNAGAAMPEQEAPRDSPASAWITRLAREGWWCDAALDAEGLARRLGTNRAYLARALAPHGGFNAVVGRLRAEAVAARLDSGTADDLLSLALDAGFGSKASFNRAFRSRFGISPSAYRRGAPPATGAMLRD